MLLVPLGVENALITSDSICLLIIGGKESHLLCEASKGSSEIESGRYGSYAPFPFLEQENTSLYSFSSGRAPMKIETQKMVFDNTSQSSKLFLAQLIAHRGMS